jgi:hypothetical protein
MVSQVFANRYDPSSGFILDKAASCITQFCEPQAQGRQKSNPAGALFSPTELSFRTAAPPIGCCRIAQAAASMFSLSLLLVDLAFSRRFPRFCGAFFNANLTTMIWASLVLR